MHPCFIKGYLFSSVLSFRRNLAPKLASTPKVGVFVPFFPKGFWVSVSVVSHSFLVAFIIVSNIIIIKRDFLKDKTVKANDKNRRFGVVMTPLSR